MRGTARTVPPATSALQGRLPLVSHTESRPAQTPARPRWGGDTCVGRQGSQIPALLGSGRWAVLSSPRPPASLPRGPGHHRAGFSSERDCIALSASQLASTQTLFKSWKIPAGERHRQEWRAGQGSSVGNASRHAGWEIHRIWQRSQGDVHYPGQAWPPRCASSLAQAPAQHGPHRGVRHTWGQAAGACQPCPCQAAPARGSMAHRAPTTLNTHL